MVERERNVNGYIASIHDMVPVFKSPGSILLVTVSPEMNRINNAQKYVLIRHHSINC